MSSEKLEIGQIRFWCMNNPNLHFKIGAITEHEVYYKYLDDLYTIFNFSAPKHLVVKHSSLTPEYLANNTIKEWLNE
jgi:hypothetical protein